MKNRFIVIVLSLMFSVGLFCSELPYKAIDPNTIPIFVGSINDPSVKIVYEDPEGEYIFIEINGILYVYYL
ncbi:MAG TPA: hypothetical protein PLF50_07040 [Candidatus Cloacimonadota bacterium]|nr:hypothetical protein [Candidatus Cloacimonadota bacterium]HOV17227.1 hypothetical protein [Candidatus Cloacimonadota bacterium]HQL14670.1 hypothetical protein [Candidatus Cloacimonadota bacterium]